MADRASLKVIGFVMAGLTAGVMMIAAAVTYHTISAGLLLEDPPIMRLMAADVLPSIR